MVEGRAATHPMNQSTVSRRYSGSRSSLTDVARSQQESQRPALCGPLRAAASRPRLAGGQHPPAEHRPAPPDAAAVPPTERVGNLSSQLERVTVAKLLLKISLQQLSRIRHVAQLERLFIDKTSSPSFAATAEKLTRH